MRDQMSDLSRMVSLAAVERGEPLQGLRQKAPTLLALQHNISPR